MVSGPELHTKYSTNRKRIIFYNSRSIVTVILKLNRNKLDEYKDCHVCIYRQAQFYLHAYLQEKKYGQIFCRNVWIKFFLKTGVSSRLLILWLSFNNNNKSRVLVVLRSTKKFPAWEVNDWGEKLQTIMAC